MKTEIDLDVPKGFEATGEYRNAVAGEWILDSGNAPFQCYSNTFLKFIILRKKKSKVICFVPVATFDEATCEAGYKHARYGVLGGEVGVWHADNQGNVQWLRREEREETV